MSGLVLPPPEPPSPEVQELLALLNQARMYLHGAEEALGHAQRFSKHASAPASMVTRVMLKTRAVAVEAWADEVSALEEHARAMGLQP